jgi:hypothetical protein
MVRELGQFGVPRPRAKQLPLIYGMNQSKPPDLRIWMFWGLICGDICGTFRACTPPASSQHAQDKPREDVPPLLC